MQLKLFGRNATIYAFGNIGLRISSFLLIPLYTHTLSMEEYGTLATLLMTVQILLAVMGFGTQRSFTRFATEYDNQNKTGLLFSSILQLNIISGIIVTIITLIIFKSVLSNIIYLENINKYILMTCGVAITQSLFLNTINYYRTFNDGLKYAISSLTAAFLMILLTLVMLQIFKMGIPGVLLAQILTYSILGFFISVNIVYKKGVGFSHEVLKKIIIFGFPLIFSMSADLVLDTTALYFLGFFSDLKMVAIYSIGYKLAQIAGMVLILPFQLAYEPFVFANIRNKELNVTISKLVTYLLLLFSFVALGIVFISRKLLPIIAPSEYSQSYLIIFLILPGIAFKGIHYVGQSLLHIKNRSYVTGITATLFTILSVSFNYIFIKLFGIFGAVFVFNFTMIGSALVLIIIGMKTFPIPLEKMRLTITCFLSVIFLFLVFSLKNTEFYIYYTIIPIIAISVFGLLYYFNFFYDEEKTLIYQFICKTFRIVSP